VVIHIRIAFPTFIGVLMQCCPDVSPRRINEIVHGKRAITADTALRLSRALGLSDMFFVNMQAHYDAEVAREHLATALAAIDRIA
jgi:plasmid maintenance system antidote protein VapI